jgi:hypothetical protein
MFLIVFELLDMETKGSLLLIFVGFIFEKYDFFGSCSVLLLWIRNLRSFVDSLFCGVVFPILSGDLDLFVGLSGSDSCLCVSLDVLVEEDVEDEDDDEDDVDVVDEEDEDDDDDEELEDLRVVLLLWSSRHPKSSANVMKTLACGCGNIASGP